MATEPDFLSQNGQPMQPYERLKWWSQRASEATAKGAQWHRFAIHPEQDNLILYEGWRVMPVDADGNLDEGEPKFQFTATGQLAEQHAKKAR